MLHDKSKKTIIDSGITKQKRYKISNTDEMHLRIIM